MIKLKKKSVLHLGLSIPLPFDNTNTWHKTPVKRMFRYKAKWTLDVGLKGINVRRIDAGISQDRLTLERRRFWTSCNSGVGQNDPYMFCLGFVVLCAMI